MLKKFDKANTMAVLNLAFWSTVLVVRFLIFLSLERNRVPAIYIEGWHLHHFVFGFLILLISLLGLYLERKNEYVYLATLGIGLGLVTDEFLYWTHLDFNYWSLANLIAILLVGTILLMAYWKERRRQGPQSKNWQPPSHPHLNPEQPLISVVIPAFNEAAYLPMTLQTLLAQDLKEFELIVVDNNSTDETAKIASIFGAKVIKESRPGVSFARQAGFTSALGQIIATTDADTLLPADWLSKIGREFMNPDLVAFGGLYKLYSGPILARLGFPKVGAWAFERDYKLHGSWALPGANMAVRKKDFLAIGGFNTALKILEDADLSRRLSKVGTVKFNPHFLVSTSGRRYRRGLLAGLSAYLPSQLSLLTLRKVKFNRLKPVRQEHSALAAVVLPLVSATIFLIFLFSFYTPPLVKAKEAARRNRAALYSKTKQAAGKVIQKGKNIDIDAPPFVQNLWKLRDLQ